MNIHSKHAGLLALLFSTALSAAQVPQIISYQGDLKLYGTNFSGPAQFKFALVNSTGSQSYWSHDGTSSGGREPGSAVAVGVTNGLFQVLLGDTSILHMTAAIPVTVFSNSDVRLRIWCSDGSLGFQQLTPDQRVASAGYALRADTAGVALSLAPGVVTNTGTVTRVNTGAGLTGGPITGSGTLSIPNGGVSNAMLQSSSVTVAAGNGLAGGGAVSLGGATTLSLNVNHDATLTGSGGAASLGLNLANPNTWSATQTFASTINGSISGSAAGFTGPLAGDVTGTQGATLITNLSASKISGLFKWQTVASSSQQTVPNTGYILTSAAPVTLTLPVAAVVGDTLRLSAPGIGGWKLAQNAGQAVFAGNFESLQIGVRWDASGPSAAWTALASSADGSQLVGAVNGGFIQISTDSGATWLPHGVSTNWSAVASSVDGVKLAAAVNGGFIYTSTDSGTTWSPRGASANWYDIACSADGSKLAAVVNGGYIYTSADSGLTWTQRQATATWYAIASSSDGTRLAAGASAGQILISTNSGATWTPRGPGGFWCAIASSASGMKLVAAARNGQLYTSVDGGTNWTARDSSRNWYSVASSADGTRLVALVNGGQLYNSVDSGLTWAAHDNNRAWQAVASSADGYTLAAAVNVGQVYIARAPLVTPATTTTSGTQGYLVGEQGTALELQYIGNNQFIPLSCLGRIQAF